MNLPQIRVQSEQALLGLNIQQPKQEIRQKQADMEITQPKIELQIETKQAELFIDASEARADIGFVGPLRSTEEFAQIGYEAWLQAIAETAAEGDQLMKIHENPNALIDIAKKKGSPEKKETVLAFVPKFGSVKLNWTPHEVNINWKATEAELDVQVHKPVHNYIKGAVETYIRQEKDLQIDFTGVTIDIKK